MKQHWLARQAIASSAISAAALFLSACGPTSSSSASGGPSSPAGSASPTASSVARTAVNSCTVITQAEASAALSQQVRAPVRGKATVEGGVACVFYGPSVPPGTSPNIPVGDSVRVVLVTGPNAVRYFNDYRSKVKAQAIAGLGDKAYYDGYASISVLKGDEYVRIAVGIASNLPAEKALAAEALTRM